jgi:oxygen-dependent protoporphyrinogen oxidase
LIEELNLQQELLFTGKEANLRYVYRKGKLCAVPSLQFLLPVLKPLCMEWKKPVIFGDESIWDFVTRRFNQKTAELLFDPLVTGIYAGDLKKLSIASCFPNLKKWEEEQGSVTRGYLSSRKKNKDKPDSLFSLQGGMQKLVEKLEKGVRAKILTGHQCHALQFLLDKVCVVTGNQKWDVDFLFSALPCQEIGELLNFFPLKKINSQSLAVAHVGFRTKVLQRRGFGYLVPSSEKEEILGMVFDSNLFLQAKDETRLTVMLSHGGNYERKVLSALQKHLGISQRPDFLEVSEIPRAIPQFRVGHAARIEGIREELLLNFPRLRLVGNYLGGVSVNDTIAFSKQVAENFIKETRKSECRTQN